MASVEPELGASWALGETLVVEGDRLVIALEFVQDIGLADEGVDTGRRQIQGVAVMVQGSRVVASLVKEIGEFEMGAEFQRRRSARIRKLGLEGLEPKGPVLGAKGGSHRKKGEWVRL